MRHRDLQGFLDGYDQMDLITGKGPSNRHEVVVLRPDTLGALRVDNYNFQFIDQPKGWIGVSVKPNMPKLTNLRQDPFERMNWPGQGFAEGSVAYWNTFKHEMWRFQILRRRSRSPAELHRFSPMQAGASFSVGDLKEKIEVAMKAAQAHNQ